MNRQRTFLLWASQLCLGLLVLCLGTNLFALDNVHKLKDKKPVGGEIEINRTEVTVTQKGTNKVTKIPANEVDYIEWEGEPVLYKSGRANERVAQNANLRQAIEDYKEALTNPKDLRDQVKTELEFALARALSKKAVEPEEYAEAIKLLKKFTDTNRDSYHYYEGLMQIGELGMQSEDFESANKAFAAFATCPWPDFQMAAKIGIANSKLGRGDVDGAKRDFESIISLPANNPAEKSRQLSGKLGVGRCLLEQKHPKDALPFMNQVIADATEDDGRVQAEAYVRQGDCLVALGASDSAKAAVLAYLHVDVMPTFSQYKDLHAESLFKLSELWKKANEPARAAAVSQKLSGEYPSSPWAKKLPAEK